MPTDLLLGGDIEVVGRMPYSSNATFLVRITHGDTETKAIYKPLRGERPLWDFPPGLYKREIAAYVVSEHLGLHVVPPTVERDGPYG
ncbi:MAG: phosphatidylinositol kinase, partial [Actinomycetota bacterium]